MGRAIAQKNGNDKVNTPIYLCKQIVEHFKPSGKILEPCCGEGNFLKVMESDWFEIDKGKDFMQAIGHWDWIFLQNGQEIVFAKKKRVARLDDFTYALKYVEDTCKALVYDVKDIDIIFLKK